jgi:hypothetical protein
MALDPTNGEQTAAGLPLRTAEFQFGAFNFALAGCAAGTVFLVCAKQNVRAKAGAGQFNIFGAIEEIGEMRATQVPSGETSKLVKLQSGLSTGSAQEMQKSSCQFSVFSSQFSVLSASRLVLSLFPLQENISLAARTVLLWMVTVSSTLRA